MATLELHENDMHLPIGNRLFYQEQNYDGALVEYRAILDLCLNTYCAELPSAVAHRHCCIARALFYLKDYDRAVVACQNAIGVLDGPSDQHTKDHSDARRLYESIMHLRDKRKREENDSTSALDLSSGKSGNLLGISVSYLGSTFLAEVIVSGHTVHSRVDEIEDLDREIGHGVIRQKGAGRVCPADGKPGSSYVHCLHGKDVGKATHMLSYSWSYSIGEIINTLYNFCQKKGLDPSYTYIWLCCLCVNQHRVAAQSAKKKSGMPVLEEVNFFTEFGERVTSIGHVIAMMTPWNQPTYLTRVWCVFELYKALQSKIQLSVAMPPAQLQTFKKDLLGDESSGISMLYAALGNTRVQDATASVENDRLAILRLIEASPGYGALNHQVNEFLRMWARGAITEVVESHPDTNDSNYAKFCSRIGRLWMTHGELKEALRSFRISLAVAVSVSGSHEASAACHNEIGKVLIRQGKYDDALREHGRALSIYRNLFGDNHVLVAMCHNLLGVALCYKSLFDLALEEHQKAMAIFSEKFDECEEMAEIHSSMGEALRHQGKFDASLQEHQLALSMRESVLGIDHILTAESHRNIGVVLECKSTDAPMLSAPTSSPHCFTDALKHHERALAIYESSLGPKHVEVARTLCHMGSLLTNMRSLQGAQETIRKTLSIQESVLGMKHVDTATSYLKLGNCFYCSGDQEAAANAYHEAQEIFESTLGAGHPDSIACRQHYSMAQKAAKLTKLGTQRREGVRYPRLGGSLAGENFLHPLKVSLSRAVDSDDNDERGSVGG